MTAEGSFAQWFRLGFQPQYEVSITKRTTNDVAFELRVDRYRSVALRIASLTSGTFFNIQSAPSRIAIGEPTFVAATWSLPRYAALIVDGHVVAQAGEEPASSSGTGAVPSAPPIRQDYSEQNRVAKEARRLQNVSSPPAPRGRLPGRPRHFEEALQAEIDQLDDLLSLVQQGKRHHVYGIAARLRLLIVIGQPMPLLQACAARGDLPLIAYTYDVPLIDDLRGLGFDRDLEFQLTDEIGAAPEGNRNNPIDLDVWLNAKTAIVNRVAASHRQLLRAIGDTVGAHVDAGVEPSVAALKSLEHFNVDGARDQMEHLVVRVANVVSVLGRSVLQHNGT